jgi:hypothetical protein
MMGIFEDMLVETQVSAENKRREEALYVAAERMFGRPYIEFEEMFPGWPRRPIVEGNPLTINIEDNSLIFGVDLIDPLFTMDRRDEEVRGPLTPDTVPWHMPVAPHEGVLAVMERINVIIAIYAVGHEVLLLERADSGTLATAHELVLLNSRLIEAKYGIEDFGAAIRWSLGLKRI